MRSAANAIAAAFAIVVVAFHASSAAVSASPSVDEIVAPLQRVAFGSCNDQSRAQPLWPSVLANEPQLWIWMGDAIYADFKVYNEVKTYLPPFPVSREAPPEMLREKYALQLENPGYMVLRQKVPVIGVWDDHDYGINDGDRRYTYRTQSQQIFLDFMGEPAESPRRHQDGVYTSYTIGSGDQTTKFMLLDVRYNKDPYSSTDGDFLGAAQWHWLEQELTSSSAAFNVIVSGVQMLTQDRVFVGENWNRFPAQRERLINLILTANVKGVILLSGDVHFAEINQIQCDDYATLLTEVTSSGMTHSWGESSAFQSLLFRAANIILPADFRPHRQAYYGLKNFGEIVFDWDATPLPRATIHVRGEDGEIKLSHTVTSHYVEHADKNLAKKCRAIQESNPLVVLLRQLTMVGFVGLLL